MQEKDRDVAMLDQKINSWLNDSKILVNQRGEKSLLDALVEEVGWHGEGSG